MMTREGMDTGLLESQRARERMLHLEKTPLFYCDWLSALFILFEIDRRVLQPFVPYELDCREGRAYVSLVAFSMQKRRPVYGGRLGAWMCAPIARHPFLNVRTYVEHDNEPGIFFLTEWLPNAVSVLLGPPVFGLPYRYGHLNFLHDAETGTIGDTVEAGDSATHLTYHGVIDTKQPLRPCGAGSLDAFLLERYTAYTCRRKTPLYFRIWHSPWPQTPANITFTDTSLLETHCPWFTSARQITAHFSSGVEGVWVGFPRRVQSRTKGDIYALDPNFQERTSLGLV